MNPSKPPVQPDVEQPVEIEPEISPDRSPSSWFLLEVKPNSQADEYLVCLLASALTDMITGLRYSATSEAHSMPEALAEFAKLGRCEQSLQVRLQVRRLLTSG
jgi:hypothetical protein